MTNWGQNIFAILDSFYGFSLPARIRKFSGNFLGARMTYGRAEQIGGNLRKTVTKRKSLAGCAHLTCLFTFSTF
jgi:hypothetical protein